MDLLKIVMILGAGAAVCAMIKELVDFKKNAGREKMEEKVCSTCKWWEQYTWCCLEPKKVAKMHDDFCSHWTPKELNEVQQLNEVKQ